MKRYLPMLIIVGAMFLILIGLTYCEPKKKDILDGSIWRVEELNGQPLIEFSTLTIRFHHQKISGSSECNRFKGNYELKGEQIKFDISERTNDRCMEPGIMEQEIVFIDTLETLTNFSLTPNRLQLYSAGGEERVNLLLLSD
ncbi:MAG TPA: META domain-containing protein [Anaerolineaceae bacterium]|nr:META domain-containing protein [Anaerolineaceae bacterium]